MGTLEDQLAENNYLLHFCLVSGHQGYSGNEKADYAARKDTESPFIGPEYVCGIPKCVQEALQNARLEIHTLVNGPILQYKIMQKPTSFEVLKRVSRRD